MFCYMRKPNVDKVLRGRLFFCYDSGFLSKKATSNRRNLFLVELATPRVLFSNLLLHGEISNNNKTKTKVQKIQKVVNFREN